MTTDPDDPELPADGGDAGSASSLDEEPVVELKPFEAQRFFERRGDEEGEGDDASEDGEDDAGDGEPEPPALEDASSSQLELPAGLEAPAVPGYVVEGFIGRGATGIVYRARQQAVDRPVALKVLHPELVTNNRAVRRLKREARLAARLAHPSIISAIDMGVQDGRWWYAMELVEGVSLSRRIAERGSLTERECLRLFSPLCDALQHAHEVGVVHRDIKPANILVDGRGRARLVDLGLAMGQNDPSITKTGSTLGTPHYVSPEQARDPSQADIRSDIWSLGATMYHAVCGRPPFSFEEDESGGVAEVLSRVLYQPVVDPREYAGHLSKGFSLLLRKCLTRDPAQRYQEPWELVADIETLRERRRLDLRGSQIDSFASRRPAWLGRAGWAAAALAAVVATWLLTARPWEDRGITGPGIAAPTLGDWPELKTIRDDFDAGELRPREALLELASPTLDDLPEDARHLQSGLVVHVRAELDRGVAALVEESSVAVEAALAERDFPGARRTLQIDFPRELAARTGYRGVGDLPPGRVASTAADFQRDAGRRVEAARSAAVREAGLDLQSALDELLRREHRALVASGRYRDALAWLSLDAPERWLTREGVTLDLRGLGPDERRDVADSIDVRLDSEASAVRFSASAAARAARNALEDAESAALVAIESGDVRGDVGAPQRLEAEVRAWNAKEGLDPEQLPASMALDYGTRMEAAVDAVARAESRKREDMARADLRRLGRLVGARCSERAYGAARRLLEAARVEGWRLSTHGEIDVRLQEVAMLDDVLTRAAKGVASADGDRLTLDFGGVKHPGTVELISSQLLRDGFQLRPTRGERRALHVVFLTGDEDERARLLGTRDVLRFAGLADLETLGARERVQAAAFLQAEGRPEEAARALPVEVDATLEGIVWGLEERIERDIAAARAEQDVDRGAGSSSAEAAEPGARPVTLESVYGTPGQRGIGNDVRLVWWFVDERQPPTPLRRTLSTDIPRGEERFGSWRAGGWRTSVDGLVLDESLRDRNEYLRGGFGPSLPVLPPVDRDQGVRMRLTVRPGEAHPVGHLFSVTIEGYHAMFVDGRVWFGKGDLRDLFDHVDEGLPGDVGEFRSWAGPSFTVGEELVIEVAVRGKTLEELAVGGQVIATNKFLPAQDRDDNLVRLRSRGPMVLLGAELVAEQARVR